MMKKFVIIIILVISLISVSVQGEQFEKCVPWLNFAYNYFYGPNNNSLSRVDSVTINRTDTIRVETDSGDTTEYIIQQIPDIGDPDEFSIDNPAIYYESGVPFITASIILTGDGSELVELGATIGSHYGNNLIARFPLSILPQIDTLPSVIKILAGTLAELQANQSIDPIKPFKLRNRSDGINVKGFIEMNRHQYSIDTTGVVPTVDAMIFTNGDYSQLDSLGINTGSKLGTTVVAWIPIALIRAINELESVEKIIFPTIVRPN